MNATYMPAAGRRSRRGEGGGRGGERGGGGGMSITITLQIKIAISYTWVTLDELPKLMSDPLMLTQLLSKMYNFATATLHLQLLTPCYFSTISKL